MVRLIVIATLVIGVTAGATFLAGRMKAEGDQSSYPGWFYETEVPSASGSNILLITVDTLRPDHLGLYGYERQTSPHIDDWFGNDEVYESAYSTEANTTPSMVSLLTGMLPQDHGVRLLYQRISPKVVAVSDFLRRAGYEMAAAVSNLVLTGEASGLDTRFDYYDDNVDEPEPKNSVYERRASRTTDAAIEWLTAHRSSGRPHLLWVHYIDPHGPYLPPDDRPTEFSHVGERPLGVDITRVSAYQLDPTVTDAMEYVDRYDEEIAYTDREVGRLLAAYSDMGLSDGALMIFTADHGESMLNHEQWFAHDYHVYEEIIRIPLMIRRPEENRKSVRIATPVSHADLFPTMLREAGLPLPDTYGQPLPLQDHDAGRDIFAEASTGFGQWRALIRGRRKWVAHYELVRTLADRALFRVANVQPFLSVKEGVTLYFDLAEDPSELEGTPWPTRDGARALTTLIQADPDPAGFPYYLTRGERLDSPKVAPSADEAALEKLRSLGYVR